MLANAESFDVTIVHLEDDESYAREIQTLVPAIRKSLQDFVQTNFSFSHSEESSKNFSPIVELDVETFSSVSEMCQALISDGQPTALASRTALFLLDYYVPFHNE